MPTGAEVRSREELSHAEALGAELEEMVGPRGPVHGTEAQRPQATRSLQYDQVCVAEQEDKLSDYV